MLLKLVPPEGSDVCAVALRVFGDRTEDLIDRQRELRVLLQLNAAGFSAPVSATATAVDAMSPWRACGMRRRVQQRHCMHACRLPAAAGNNTTSPSLPDPEQGSAEDMQGVEASHAATPCATCFRC